MEKIDLLQKMIDEVDLTINVSLNNVFYKLI